MPAFWIFARIRSEIGLLPCSTSVMVPSEQPMRLASSRCVHPRAMRVARKVPTSDVSVCAMVLGFGLSAVARVLGALSSVVMETCAGPSLGISIVM
jgi:hypothetical protein